MPYPRLQPHIARIPSSIVRDKGQGSSASQNQCCLRRVRSLSKHSSPQILPTHRTTTRCQPCSSSNVFPPPPPIFQVEEEEEVEREEEGFVDLTSLTDDYEVFNQSSPSPNVSEDMGIQRKPQRSLQELLENQPGRGEAGKSAQPKLPPVPPKSPPRAPQPPLPSRIE